MNESIYIVMPTYNEELNIQKVVEEWYPILDKGNADSKLVIADGGSKDNTLNILYELQKKYPKLVVISKPETDHGTKVILLYKYAIDKKADWIFQTDSDGQTLASDFNEFWDNRIYYDIILGNRKKRGDGFFRKIVENVLRLYIKIFFGVMVPDANAPFRLMKSEIVKKYIDLMPENFNLPNAILSACFSRFKEKVIYKEVSFKSRQGGKNYMNFKRIFLIGLNSINSFAKIRNKLSHIRKQYPGE